MKVYLLMTGEPDSEIVGIFSTREKAERIKAERKSHDVYISGVEVDEYTTTTVDALTRMPIRERV